MALMFESTGCTRCGGSGHYSYCQSYGTRCFKCAGKGVTLTKRGAVAQAYFRLLLSKRYIDLEPGDKIRDEGLAGFTAPGWREVISTELVDYTWCTNGEERTSKVIKVDAVGWGMANADPQSMIRVAATGEEKRQAKAMALALQARLTKQGKVSKRKVAA